MFRGSKSKSDLRQAVEAHLSRLPEGAPMHGIVNAREIEGRIAAFDRADAIAIKKQRSYRRLGRFALWAMMAGAVIGALVLLPIDQWIAGRPRKLIEGLQALALILTFMAIFWIGVRQSVGQWMQSRAEAERLRADVFRAIMRAGADGKELLSPALACFRDAHLDWQLGFLKRRGQQHRQSAGHATPYKAIGYLLLALAVCLGAAGLVTLADDFGLSPWPPVKTVARWLLPHEHERWQLGLGAIASSVLAFASARTFMDQNDRNAACYALAAAELEHIRAADLSKAEAAAKSGNVADVMDFCEKVQKVMDAEHLAWLFARPPSDVNVFPKPDL